MKTIASLNEVTKSFSERKIALSNVSLNFTNGITALIGANGSGKSTLLSLLGGALIPDKGSIVLMGNEPQSDTPNFRSSVGFATQKPALDGEITGQESIDLFCVLNGITKHKSDGWLQNLLEVVNLTDELQKQVRTYSGGMRQKLHLIMSILHQPQIWLLDEPTSALDPKTKEQFWSFLGFEKKERCIIMALHDLDEVETYADHVCILDDGQMAAFDTPEQIICDFPSMRWTFTTKNGKEAKKLKQLLDDHTDITKSEQTRQKVIVSTKHTEQSADYYLSLAAENNLEIKEVSQRSRDLTTAFFEITGKSAPNAQKSKSKKQLKP